jgi:hypothetical protein
MAMVCSGVWAVVELAVPSPGQAVAHDIARGCFDGSGAGVGGERRAGVKAVDVADPGEDLPSGEIADAAKLGQGGATGSDRGSDVVGDRGDAPLLAGSSIAVLLITVILTRLQTPAH